MIDCKREGILYVDIKCIFIYNIAYQLYYNKECDQMLKKFLLFLTLLNIFTFTSLATSETTQQQPANEAVQEAPPVVTQEATEKTTEETAPEVADNSYQDPININDDYIQSLYNELGLTAKLEFSIFKRGYKGYLATPDRKKGHFTIIDYTKPSNEKRFFVIDLKNKKLKYESLVAHGKNSGLIVPVNFSNTRNSFQTSLGFYKTAESYSGSYGYSLKLVGLEEGFNSNAYERKIVIHGSREITPQFIQQTGFLGRSDGCPSLPPSIAKEVIDFIKDGSVIYVIGNDSKYMEDSTYTSM